MKTSALGLTLSLFILAVLWGCDTSPDSAGPPSEPTSKPVTPSYPHDGADTPVSDSPPDSWVVVDNSQSAPPLSIEDAVMAFLAASEEEQSNIAFMMEPSAENAALVVRLLPQNISVDVKLSLLSALEDGEFQDILPALQSALYDPSPEVVIAAINILGDSEKPEAIPLLQPLAESAANEDVREAAQEAIDSLQM